MPKVEFATIGDGLNHVFLFGQAGFSIAMGNASEEVRSHANAATDSYQDDGFAKAIEKHIPGTGSCEARGGWNG